MNVSAAHIDLYQLTSLVTHHAAGRAHDRVVMTFLSRGLPKSPHTDQPARGFLLFAGLGRCLDYLEHARFDRQAIDGLLAHPMLGPVLADWPDLVEALHQWRFSGTIWAPREGTPLFAGLAVRRDGSPLEIDGARPAAYTPYLIVETDLLSAKLIETPLLSILNHMTMVATKAAHLVETAQERPVIEFGTRRTHPDAAVDAAVAAWIGGVTSTSNVAAHLNFGIPMSGTMDHFAVQAWEQPDLPRHETETAFFRAFHQQYPGKDILLVDTYDTFGAKSGIHAAVAATEGDGPFGIRIDSGVTPENVWRARQLLDGLGAIDTKIFVSGGIDEAAMLELRSAPVDGFGVGENLVVSSDAPVGVGAVGKLSVIRGLPTTKLSRGSAKSHLPGIVQVWRTAEGDLVGLADEHHDGEPLLHEVWSPIQGRMPIASLREARDHARTSLASLSAEQKRPRTLTLPVTDRLASLFEELARRD